MKLTNKLNLPQPIVDAVSRHEYTGDKNHISVTTLIDTPLQAHLKRKHHNDIEEDVSDRIYALMGSAIHTVLERADSTAIKEKRLTIEINGVHVTGQFDRLALISDKGGISGLLQDYKFAAVREYIYGLKSDRENQLNVYAYMLRKHGYKVSKLQIVMIFRDWQKTKAINDRSYPQQQVGIINVDLWSEEKQLAYIKSRIVEHTKEPHECTSEEKWARPTTYAVMKGKNKRAARVFNTGKEAQNYIDKIVKPKDRDKCTIEVRPGENMRCKYYCSVSKFCPYNTEVTE